MMLKLLQRPFLIFYCFLLFLSRPALAETDPYENTLVGPFQNGATFTVKDKKFQNTDYNWGDITNFSVKDAVTLRIIDNVLIPYQFTYTVSLKIDYYTDPNSGPTSINRDLTVNYDPGQGVRYKGTDSYAFEGAYKITVTVLGVNAHGGTSPTGPVVQLSSNIVISRQSLFQPQSAINPAIVLADHNQVKINWDFVTGAEEYDIEWTTINSGNENFAAVDQQQKGLNFPDPEAYKVILGQAFRNNSSRVTTANHDYVLSMLSTDTYFLLRIRQVQYSPGGVRLTGDWDYKNKNGGYAIIPVGWNEPGLNWQYSASFAEEGKKKEVISYFDGTLRSRQTVTLNNADSIALAQENIYDEFGRKAAAVLPAPFKEDVGKSYLHYASNFNLNPSGSPYNFLNLQGQLPGCEPAPDSLIVSAGASRYYSKNNSFLTSSDKPFNKFIPDASGFPIAVTQYTSDNTGRVKLQGGVGLAFQPGPGLNGGASKTTRYYYGKPEQWELDQLFGNDVGYAEHYLKNMVVDPNGQISISYLNGSGKTIATALTGAPPANLNAVSSYNPSGQLKRTGLLKPEQFVYSSSALKLTATTTYLASVTGPGTLTYNIQKLVSNYPGGTYQICSNCYYEMTVKVVNDCNEQVAGTSTPVQIGSMLANCADTARYQDSLVVPFNQIGEYHVTIEFAFNKDVIDQYTDSFISQGQANGAVEKEFGYIKKRYLDSLDVSGCYADCKTCSVLLGGQGDFVQMLKDKFLSMDLDATSVNGPDFDSWANGLYTTLKSKCTALQGSCDLSPCSAIQNQMQDDISPGGQYALFDTNGNALEPNINVLTMTSAGNTVPNWRVQFPVKPSTDALYQSELITLDDGGQTSPYDAGFTIQMLIKYWKTDWATRFLAYHPEYCQLQFCQTMGAFESWDQNVQQQINKASDVPTIPGGAALNFNPSNASDWLITADPFFQIGAPGYSLQSQFRSDLLQYSVRVMGITSASAQIKGLLEFKDYLLYCADPSATTNTGSSANSDSWNNCTPNNACRVPDREWTSYRDGYFQLKEKYYTILRNASCGALCPIGQPLAVPLAGESPTISDFSIRPFSEKNQACIGGQTILISYNPGTLTTSVDLTLYYPSGFDSSTFPHVIHFYNGEHQKTFCIPSGYPSDVIEIKSIVPTLSSSESAIIGDWVYYRNVGYYYDSNGQENHTPLVQDKPYGYDPFYHYNFKSDHTCIIYQNPSNINNYNRYTWRFDSNGNLLIFQGSTRPTIYKIKENTRSSLVLTIASFPNGGKDGAIFESYFRPNGSTYTAPFLNVATWANLTKDNDRSVTDNGTTVSAADFNIRTYKGGDATNHPEATSANNLFLSYEFIYYKVVDNLQHPYQTDYHYAYFIDTDVKSVNINDPNIYYSAGNYDLSWSLDYYQSDPNWAFLGYRDIPPPPGAVAIPGWDVNIPPIISTANDGSSTCMVPSSTTDYWSESAIKGINLITNGDFSSGNTGFSSTYTYINPDGSYSNPNATSAGGFYHFTTNPQSINPNYYSFGDHTTGTGQMLYLDGGANPSAACWSKNVTVEANKTYVLSIWASTSTNNAANLQFKINGAQVGNTLQLTETPGWQNFLVQWDSGSNTSALLTIHDLNTSPDGNDFAMDDFVFAPVCVATPVSASCISPGSTTNYFVEAADKGINQVTNGDFSSGDTGFSSTYTYINPDGSYSNPNATSAGGFYHFTTNPQLINPGYYAFGDHTTGTGPMLYLDGGANPSAPCWSKNTVVGPNKTYVFSVWASTSTNNAANLQFKINGVQVGNNLQLTETPGWQNFLVQWESGSNTSALLSIHDLNTRPDGNDFALDDIVFAPVCTSSGCPEAYTYKQSRFPTFAANPVNITTTAQGGQLWADTKNSIAAMAIEQAKAGSEIWISRLKPGLDALGTDSLTRESLRANLVAIYLAGSDLAHPYGTSTLASGTSAGNGYSSFGDAIKGVLGLNGYTPGLNPWLIDAPYPYLPLQQSIEKSVSATSNEICNLLTVLSNAAQASNMDLYSYLLATYHDAMTLTPAEVASLQKSCTNCRFLLAQDITLPVFLEPGTKGCIVPSEYAVAKSDLNSQFGGSLSTTDANYETIFSNFMNFRWGFSLTFDDYKQYESTVASNPVASLCNSRPYSSTNDDPYACIKSAMEVAIANGEKDYNTCITDQKSAFKASYISTCSLAQASAGLSANQQVYHYTLYYYDQADNLIRTVPPGGVTLLSDNDVAKAASYRKGSSGTVNCESAYDWSTLANSSISDALTNLGGKINTAGNMAVEMWLYNAESTSSQVLLTTANRNYMFHTSILGKYLTVEVYTFDPNSSPSELRMVLSNRVAADISAQLPLNPWSHLVIQGAALATSKTPSLYLNGTALTLLSDPALATANGWQISSGSNPIQAPDNYSTLKHLRLYNRLMDYSSEIMPNANNTCFLPARTDGMDWYRFNIPPAGSITTVAANSTVEYNSGVSPVYPSHVLLTTYAYNSTNQVVQQTSPDGGTNRFWYDYIRRPIISQNDKQLANNDYSYTAYDALGRITEVGQKNQTGINLGEPGYRYEDGSTPSFLSAGTNSQITQTIYDTQPAAAGGIPSGLVQENLRKRVAASLYRETQDADVLRASYYNYDLDGNVKTLTQQVDGIGLKQMGYEYDLISGKVNFVRYQDGQPDQFYYKYNYDAENRLTDAWSGTAALVDLNRGSTLLPHNQKLDAHYDYYLHGPLARTELGDVYGKVQGTDYAYTMQGWLKGINGTTASIDEDMGADGTDGIHSTIARDAHAMALFYHAIDYNAIGGKKPFINITDFISEGNGRTNFTSLYNGNIAASTNKLTKVEGNQYFHSYRYDQLNRLATTQTYQSNLPWVLQNTPIYNETFTYDGNGNILTVNRNAAGPLVMDDLTYAYNRDGDGKLLNNRLRHVKDGISWWAFNNDLSSQDDDNYSYDAMGNLTKDAHEGIDNIDWTVYGKIRSISKNDGTQISYAYNPSGNRVSKTVNGVTTWYIRDAQGNVMGLYDNQGGGTNWREQHLYGSSRLGTWGPNINLSSGNGTAAWDTIGKKSYELTNHLGNVMATISDKRLQHTSDGSAIDYFDADVQTAQEYYSFGSIVPGRTYSPGNLNYRYGFNGKENDNDVKKALDGSPNVGTQQDYGMRIYDPRLGRFLSVDPLSPKYPELTPYQFASNSPIRLIDIDGLEGGIPISYGSDPESQKTVLRIVNGTVDGVKTSLNNTWNFVTRDAYKKDTWYQAGHLIEETMLSSSAYSNIYNPNTPRLDAAVKSFETNIINGNAYTRAKFSSQLATDIATSYVGSKGLGVLKGAAQIAIRTELASSFYAKVGYSIENAAQHMEGINFSKPVQTTTVEKGTVLQQWVGKNGVGSYFTDMENGTTQNLGLGDYEKRTLKQFIITEDVKVLRSTAADLNGHAGGGTQYFSPELKSKITPKVN